MCVVVTDKLCPLNCACPGVKCDTSEVKKKNSCFHSVLKMDTQATLSTKLAQAFLGLQVGEE